jgi:hypothetical protein
MAVDKELSYLSPNKILQTATGVISCILARDTPLLLLFARLPYDCLVNFVVI